ncbi:MAG: galactokinase, partial [Cellulosilyticaceae bacterium]
TLVEAAWHQTGVLGARMTGAGFGGCALAVVANDQIEEFITNVAATYANQIGYEASFYVASIGNGPCEITQA